MADAKVTMLDIARQNNSDRVVGLIEEASLAIPEVGLFPARTIKGTQYKTLVRSALPDVGYRKANEGVAVTKSTLENRLVECFILDGSWHMDKAVADAAEDGPMAACAVEASGHVQGAFQSLAKQIYYGPASGVSGAADGPPGLINALDATNMEVDVTGTGTLGSSVWAVKFGPQGVQIVFGKDGKFSEGEIIEQMVTLSSKHMWAYAQELLGWQGLAVHSTKAIGRIRDLTTGTGKTLTDAMMGALLAKFSVGWKPDVFLMSRRSLEQLRSSRTATNATGAPAPTPTEYEGIPIVPTDAITNTETCV